MEKKMNDKYTPLDTIVMLYLLESNDHFRNAPNGEDSNWLFYKCQLLLKLRKGITPRHLSDSINRLEAMGELEFYGVDMNTLLPKAVRITDKGLRNWTIERNDITGECSPWAAPY